MQNEILHKKLFSNHMFRSQFANYDIISSEAQ